MEHISKLTSKSQTVIPAAIRKALSLSEGDMVRYKLKGRKVEIEKYAPMTESDDPFAQFTEWSSDADDIAYKDL